MKKLTLLLFAIVFTCCTSSISAQEKKVTTLKVSFINSYCGGARPTDEMIAEYSIAKPLTNSQLILIPVGMSSKKSINVKLNAKGEANVILLPGTYSVKMAKKFNKHLGLNYDSSCGEMLKRVWQTVEIKADQNTVEFSLSFACNPCLPPRP